MDFLAECKRHGLKQRIPYRVIAMAAMPSWTSRTQIVKWLSCDARYDGVPDRLIRRLLTQEPPPVEKLRQLSQ